jgi:hypothetical protein
MAENILHRIKAYLYDNALTADNPDDFTAKANSERSLTVKQTCEAAVSRGGADISASAMEHAVNLFHKEQAYQLCDGFSVNTGWYMAGVKIKGTFQSPNEQFDPKKHSIVFEFRQGDLLRKELKSVTVDVLGVADSGLRITQVTDVKTGSVNGTITPNRNLKISGAKLKIVGDAEDNGVYFIRKDNGERTKVDPTDIVINNPSELVIVIPELEAGDYQVEAVTQYAGNIPLKEPRSFIFSKLLIIEN